MRRIDIFISFPTDVQVERSVAERLIRSVAAEFCVPVSVSYSNWLRRQKQEDEITAQRGSPQEESTLLCPCFWEYQDLKAEQEYREHVPNTGHYDLVICILWSRLGSKLAPTLFMPDGSQPGSATDYEVAWVLDHSRRTPGFPTLHIYRNLAAPSVPLEPKEKREIFCRQWDSVQEFFAAWQKTCGTEFVDCCHDYQDLEEFENLFREHFRDFLAARLDREIVAGRALRKAHYRGSNPFRGLSFFDFEHAPIYHGRTKAVGEVLNALKKQAMAKKPFVLVLGASGSGKSSLIRAGVLPLLTQVGTPLGNGPWRRALTRPGIGGAVGDPFDALGAALLAKSALPELQYASPKGRWSLASELRKDPDSAAIRLTETLDQLSLQELDHLLDQQESEALPATSNEGAELAKQNRLSRVKPKMQLALVVDQLEELFADRFSPELQRRYIAVLGALVCSERIFVVAALRSDFYARYQQFPELVELTDPSGRYELQRPRPHEIRNMIRLPAEAAGLRFERHPDTGQSLDEALLDASVASSEPLPLLEQLLSQLYQRQLERKDNLIRWSDYYEFGELQGALAKHVETVFLTLKSDEQQALKFVMPHLVSLGRGEEGVLIRRTVPYRDLVSPREVDHRQDAGAKGLVDRLIKEGLLSTETDARQELLVGVAQEALLRRWPGVMQWLSEDRNFLRMRDRLDGSLTRWLSRGRQTNDLLGGGVGLAEAESLLKHFGWSLSENQVDYIEKSLAKQKRRRRMRDNIRLGVGAGLAVLATVWVVEQSNTEIRRQKGEQGDQQAQQNADLPTNQISMLEAQLKKAQEDARQAQQNADLATTQRSALEAQLKKAQEEKVQLARQGADLAAFPKSAPNTKSHKERESVRAAHEDADLAANQSESEQIQPPNPGQIANPPASIQPLDSSVQSARP